MSEPEEYVLEELLGFLGRLVFFVRYFGSLCVRIYGYFDFKLNLRKSQFAGVRNEAF